MKIPSLWQHQTEGVTWLKKNRKGILADEMGLGKTAQAITASIFSQHGKVLIICPVTLARNWKKEIKMWAPHEKVHVVMSGNKVNKAVDLLLEDAKYFIVAYESVSSLLPILLRCKFSGFILDEAHKIGNRTTKMYKAVKELADYYSDVPWYLLTGTPLRNKPEELFSLLSVLDPQQYNNFGQWANRHLYGRSVYVGNSWQMKYTGARDPEAFKEYMKVHVLRRLKDEVLNLPEKMIDSVDLELEGEQLEMYKSMSERYCIEWENEEKQGRELTAPVIIAAITRMKQLCVSPALITDRDTDRPLWGVKIAQLHDDLEDIINSGDQVVVFSQFASALSKLHKQYERYPDYKCGLLTGEVTNENRDKVVTDFQAGLKNILFAGIKVGGLGITLTKARYAIFLDYAWTPADNGQAADRIHRIGQDKTCFIKNYVAMDTIEQYIFEILGEKSQIFSSLIPHTVGDKITNNGKMDWRAIMNKGR